MERNHKGVTKVVVEYVGYVFFSIAVGILLGWVLSIPFAHGAGYGEKCDSFAEGFRDGYCVNQRYGCNAPGWAPVCVEDDHYTIRGAYHSGFSEGESQYDSDFPGGQFN